MLEKITNEDIKYMAKKCVSMIFEHVGDNYDSSCSYIFCKNEDGSWCILCGRRGNTAFSGRNLYNPPMGMKEFGETAVQCAVRECEEETGLSLPENLFKFVNSEEYGDGKNDQERGECCAERGTDGATRLAQLITNECGNIDGEDTGTTLGNGYQVKHLVLRYPLLSVHYLFLYQRYHGISTTKGEYANLKECFK